MARRAMVVRWVEGTDSMEEEDLTWQPVELYRRGWRDR